MIPSPNSFEVYRKLGFVPDREEQVVEGIRLIPMTHTKSMSSKL